MLCIGSTTNDFGVPGVAANAISLDTAIDADRFHRRLLAACVRADDEAAQGRSAHVDIVIIGAGATGVELAAEIRQTTREHVGYGLDKLDPRKDIRLTVARSRAAHPAAARASISRDAATELLAKLDVSVRAAERVTAVDAQRGAHRRRKRAARRTWWYGRRASRRLPFLASLDGLEVNRLHQLVVTETLQTTRDPDIFAFGDCAACPWPGERARRAGWCRRGRRPPTSRRRCFAAACSRGWRGSRCRRFAFATSDRSSRSASCPPSAT